MDYGFNVNNAERVTPTPKLQAVDAPKISDKVEKLTATLGEVERLSYKIKETLYGPEPCRNDSANGPLCCMEDAVDRLNETAEEIYRNLNLIINRL